MIPKRLLLFVICSLGLNICTILNSYSQTRIYTNAVVNTSTDFIGANLAIGSDFSDYSLISADAGVLSTSHITLQFPSSGKAGDVITIVAGSEGLLGVGALNNMTVRLYDSLGVNVANLSGSSVLNLTLLSQANSYYSITCMTDPNASYTFNTIRIELTNILSVNVLAEFRIYGAYFQNACPAVTGSTVYTYGSSTTPSLLSGYVTNTANAVDSDINTYATLYVPLNIIVLPNAFLDISFNVAGNATERVGFTVSQAASLLSASLIGDITIDVYNSAGTVVASKTGFTLLDLQLLSGSSSLYTLSFITPAGSYDIKRLRITMTGAVNVLESINVHNAFHYQTYPAPVAISSSGSASFCDGSSVTLTASVPQFPSGNTYLWNTGETTQSITVTSSGTYSVTVTNQAGCVMSSGPMPMTELPVLDIEANVTNITCNGKTDGAIALSVANGSGQYTYNWSNSETTSAIDSLAGGQYTVTVTDVETTCSNSAQVTVTEPQPLTLTASTTSESCSGRDGTINLNPSGGTFPYTFNAAVTVQNQKIIHLNAGSYTVEVVDKNMCKNSVTVSVTKLDCSTAINIHNVITPNSDGINDAWVIEGIEKYPNNSIQVFDKWGDLVYESINYQNGWTGLEKKNSSDLPAGTYFYLLKIVADEIPDNKSEYTGYLMIQR